MIAERAEVVWGESTLAGKKRVQRRSSLIIEACGIAQGMRVLEIGCGTGEYTLKVVQTGAMVFATDISEELLAMAARKELRMSNHECRITNVESRMSNPKPQTPNLTLVSCQAERLPFKDMSFDAVVGNAVLHHLDLPLALQEIKRVLIPHGRFAFTEPNMLNPQNMLIKNIKFLGRLVGESPDETAFFGWRIRKQLRETGFCDPMVVPFDFLHPVVPDGLVGAVCLLGEFMERVCGVRNMAGSLLITGSLTSPTSPTSSLKGSKNVSTEKVTVIIAAKDEEGGIARVVEQVKPYADEVLVVDGHSKDKTIELARQAGASVIMDNGKGKGAAYKIGAEYASGNILVFIDADGSHEPSDIPKLVQQITSGQADMVVASRMMGGSDEFHGNIFNYLRMVGGGLITLIINLRYKTQLTDVLNGFRAIKRDVFFSLKLRANDFDVEHEMVIRCLKMGSRVMDVASHEYERKWGKSKLPTFRKAHLFLWRLLAW
ncbi:methyltransferase domain-containing protein [bacterium]|nr:methyltransferase domain-containing protein [bacterium]